MPAEREQRRRRAWRLSRELHGPQITFYLPGMFVYFGRTGQYPAVSITADRCDLSCAHCGGRILAGMTPADTPQGLVAAGLRFAASGHHGFLISGGCDTAGRLPWADFIPAIQEIKARTDLFVSVHCGLLDAPTARQLKAAGVDQALIDVIGSDDTFRRICGVPFGTERIEASLNALNQAGLPAVPHIVCGLDYGKINGEWAALDMLANRPLSQVVFVSLMPLKGTPMARVRPPAAEAVADLIAAARLRMPRTVISLGCARRRGHPRLELLAIDAGVNRMALPSEEAVAHARTRGLKVLYQKTCCSVPDDFSEPGW